MLPKIIKIYDSSSKLVGTIKIRRALITRQYSWRLKSTNGRIISNHGGFNTMQSVEVNLRANKKAFANLDI